jgi:catechol 2,3-dioxygenase-like lactoylglutathione lyase family enzyme
MLGEHPITPVLLAKDLAAAREFYHDKLGLEILTENENAIVFKCGNGTHLDVTKSTVGTASSAPAGSRSRTTTCPGSRPRTASPISALPGRPGSSTRERTPSASSSSRSSRGPRRQEPAGMEEHKRSWSVSGPWHQA